MGINKNTLKFNSFVQNVKFMKSFSINGILGLALKNESEEQKKRSSFRKSIISSEKKGDRTIITITVNHFNIVDYLID